LAPAGAFKKISVDEQCLLKNRGLFNGCPVYTVLRKESDEDSICFFIYLSYTIRYIGETT